MSIKSLALNEVERDKRTPKGKNDEDPKPRTEAMVEAIPGEILAPYTAILAVIIANAEPGQWETGRWVVFAVAATLTPLAVLISWRRNRKKKATRRLPVAGMVAATVAFGSWGLVMPGGPLTYTLDDQSALTIWTTIIVVVGTAIIGWLPLTRAVKK